MRWTSTHNVAISGPAVGGAAEPARASHAKKPLPKPTCKPMPKPAEPKAINEASQVVRPDKVVEWLTIRTALSNLRAALDNLRRDQHVRLRCPRFEELYLAVQGKMKEKAIQDFIAQHKLEDYEAECILACPAEPRPRALYSCPEIPMPRSPNFRMPRSPNFS